MQQRNSSLIVVSLALVLCATLAAAVTWHADEPCFLPGTTPGAYDSVSVKDPTIVFANGKYHMFFTGKDSCCWRMGYASATTIPGLKTAPRTFMSALRGGDYFCAPQVFYFAAKNLWYLVYQNQGATFSTNPDISNPAGWTAGRTMGFGDGIDFWVIASGSDVYAFYSAQDEARTIRTRKTSIANFPFGWGPASVAITNAFEAVHVYKSRADQKYYMMVEDLYRYFQLHTANTPAGPWTLVEQYWAAGNKLQFNAGVQKWTDQVSHGEIIRAGNNEWMEIENINRADVLIQGVVNGQYGDYGLIPYRLGLIRNYVGGDAVCTTPANPANGHFTCAGAMCTLICDSGYAATGTGYSTCASGAWSSLPACVPTGAGSQACGLVSEDNVLSLSCATGQLINAVEFASYGVPTGNCASSAIGACHAASSLSVLQDACVGRNSCTVTGANSVFGDPCPGTRKSLAVRAHCAEATSVCATGGEWAGMTLTCPTGKSVFGISFASYGTPTTTTCGSFSKSSTCHAASSLDVVQKTCVGKNTCSFAGGAMNSIFGDPCSGTGKTLAVQALCV